MLTETQRVELGLFPQMFLATLLGGASDKEHPDYKACRELLAETSSQALQGMNTAAKVFVLNRIRQVHLDVEKRFFFGQDFGKIALMCWHALELLLSADVLELTEDHPLARALQIMQPMIEHKFNEPSVDASAQHQAVKILRHLQTKGYYRAWQEKTLAGCCEG